MKTLLFLVQSIFRSCFLNGLLFCVLPLSAFSASRLSCQSSFRDTSRSQKDPAPIKKELSASKTNLRDQEKSDEITSFVKSSFQYFVINPQARHLTLKPDWKMKLREYLPDFKKPHLIMLFEKLIHFRNRDDIKNIPYESSLLKILQEQTTRLLPSFNRDQLVVIIWAFKELEIKSPPESFVTAWRERALEIKTEFGLRERDWLRMAFRELKIAPEEGKNFQPTN